jgi:NAD(P)-dependent dehydrogenase (short-subunit alcohol dehydrogenase family)
MELPLGIGRPVKPAVSVITGGASGIGLALAGKLAERGGHVVLADIKEAAAQEAAEGLTAKGLSASPLTLDVTDKAAFADALRGVVAERGSLDLLANNAGIGIGGNVEELTDNHWDAALSLNLGGVINGVRAGYPIMRKQGSGIILNTASLAGLMPVPGMLPYTTTKWAVVGLSLGLRAEAQPHGIQVNVLCPSFVDTPLLDNLLDPPESLGSDPRAKIRRAQPKFLTAEQTAASAMRGLDYNKAVIAVGAVSQLTWRTTRFSPQLMAGLAGLQAAAENKRMRKGS